MNVDPKESRHAQPWDVYLRFRDLSPRTEPGRHAKPVSPTHRPTWPFIERRSA